MSTRSMIAIKEDNGFKYIRVHFDGYLDKVGRQLHNYYNKREIVEKLMDVGCMSSLEDDVADCRGYNHGLTPDDEYYDEGQGALTVDNYEELTNRFYESDAEYLYVFNDVWLYIYKYGKDNTTLRLLEIKPEYDPEATLNALLTKIEIVKQDIEKQKSDMSLMTYTRDELLQIELKLLENILKVR